MYGRLYLSVAGGLLLAGVVHVTAVLTLPDAAPRSAVTRVTEAVGRAGAPPGAMVPLAADGSTLPDLDPLFEHAACLFDGRTGPIELAGRMPPDLWTFAVVGRTRGVVASLESSAAVEDEIRVVVAPAEDVARIRLARAGPGAGETTFATVDREAGFILLRAFVAPGADRGEIRQSLSALACRSIDE